MINTILSLIVSFTLFESDDDAISLLKHLEKKYDSVKDATVSFTQHVQFGVTKAEQKFSGTIVIKKGNKYRLELEDQTIVTDGKSLWSYSKSTQQVFIDTYKENPHNLSPDKIFVNVPEKYTATFINKENLQGKEASILKLIPRDRKMNIQWMKVWVNTDEELMRRIQVLDISDNLTTYDVEEVKFNIGVKDSQFQFEAPHGVEVIDLR